MRQVGRLKRNRELGNRGQDKSRVPEADMGKQGSEATGRQGGVG